MSGEMCPVSTLPQYYNLAAYQANQRSSTPQTPEINFNFSQPAEDLNPPPSLLQGAAAGAFSTTSLGCDCYGTNLQGDYAEEDASDDNYEYWPDAEIAEDTDGDSYPDEVRDETEVREDIPSEDIPSEVEGEDYAEEEEDISETTDGGHTICSKIGDDIRITNDDRGSGYPSLVWNGREYAVSWADGRDGDSEIYFRRISETGVPIDTDIRITSNFGYSEDPSLVWNGREYGVSWRDERDGNGNIYFKRISETGTPIDPDVRISTNPIGSGADLPSLVWTGREYGVGWDDDRSGNVEIYFRRISEDGTPIGTEVRVTNGAIPSLVWNGSEYGASCLDDISTGSGGGVKFGRISEDGGLIGTSIYVADGTWGFWYPSLAWDGREYGVSWVDGRIDGQNIFFKRFSETGTPISDDVRVSNITDVWRSWTPSLVSAESGYAVSWSENFYLESNREIYFRHISEAGVPEDSEIRVTNAADYSGYPSLTWTGREYGVSWTDDRDGNSEIYFARIGCTP